MRILLIIAISLLALDVYAGSANSPVGLCASFEENGKWKSTVRVWMYVYR